MYAYSLNLTTRKCLLKRIAALHDFCVGQCSQCSHTKVCCACCALSALKSFCSHILSEEYFSDLRF
ncbi:hypothetical protein EHQ87_18800 [Proteus mirabilis]|nr:hypothetical protein EHQ87_18800 [Proteus mirabilis]